MRGDGELARGREAAGRLAWEDAYTALSLVDRSSSLAGEDLELLATAAYLLGRVEDCLWALQRAQQLHAERGYLLLPVAVQQAVAGDHAGAQRTAAHATPSADASPMATWWRSR